MKKSVKVIAAILCLVLAVGAGVGGTLAWLTDKTTDVVNTFTYGDIAIELEETTGNNYNIIPGVDIPKDPKVTVSTPAGAKDVDSYVFVKVEESANWPDFKNAEQVRKVNYQIAEGWLQLEGEENVYYREVLKDAAPKTFSVLDGDKITVSGELTKDDVDDVVTQKPTLTFTAYAVQKDGMTDAKDAWTKAGF